MTAKDTGRNARLGIRIDEGDKALLAQAAALEHMTITGFVLDAARARAERVLAEERVIRVSAETYDWFVAALDAPPKPKPRLQALLRSEDPFDHR
jgi:uncharacterized protein (DUF1778 family)